MNASAEARMGDTINDSAATIENAELQAAVDRCAREAGDRLAPYWPLQHFVAVNPLLGLADRSLADSGFIAARAHGARLTMPRGYYASLIEQGTITDADIADAVAELPIPGETGTAVQRVRAEAMQADVPVERFRLPTVATLAARRSGVDWPEILLGAISNWAADFFDKGVAVWSAAPADADPWTAYREVAAIDRTAELMGLDNARALFADLPGQPTALLAELVHTLGIPEEGLTAYFHRLLADVAGWAGYARYLGWRRELRGEDGSAARQLLAIRAAWELVLYRALGDAGLEKDIADARHHYRESDPALWRAVTGTDQVLQLAFERAMQRQLAGAMVAADREESEPPKVQAAFCIDVRSERMRRALEASGLAVQTLGFAGFYGMPVALESALNDVSARCPVLLEPGVQATECGHAHSAIRTSLVEQQTLAGRWARLQRAGVAGFGFVEAMGLGYLGKMIRAVLGSDSSADREDRYYTLSASLSEKIAMAEGMLRGMSLTRDFAPLVMFAGHGSTTTNNPYASALDCGACGGHAGDVNARLAADLLNDRFVRGGLAQRGIEIPAETRFIAALHDTTTDQVALLDTAALPTEHSDLVEALQAALATATATVRRERAPSLGVTAEQADRAVTRRAGDWSEVRPEWGLAGCYAFIAAPRERTMGMNLAGRSFLHDYRHQQDDNYAVLETILTAPLVVASWITLQYYGSCVDNRHFGSGDKTLHNVVGGIGVLEGVGGDLRAGLPMQSIHNGGDFVHAPLRLTAAVEAPPSAIDAIIDRHSQLADLVDNGWIQMHAIDPAGRLWRRPPAGGEWLRVLADDAGDARSEAA